MKKEDMYLKKGYRLRVMWDSGRKDRREMWFHFNLKKNENKSRHTFICCKRKFFDIWWWLYSSVGMQLHDLNTLTHVNSVFQSSLQEFWNFWSLCFSWSAPLAHTCFSNCRTFKTCAIFILVSSDLSGSHMNAHINN